MHTACIHFRLNRTYRPNITWIIFYCFRLDFIYLLTYFYFMRYSEWLFTIFIFGVFLFLAFFVFSFHFPTSILCVDNQWFTMSVVHFMFYFCYWIQIKFHCCCLFLSAVIVIVVVIVFHVCGHFRVYSCFFFYFGPNLFKAFFAEVFFYSNSYSCAKQFVMSIHTRYSCVVILNSWVFTKSF